MNLLYYLLFVLVELNILSNKVEGLRAENILNGESVRLRFYKYVVAVIYKLPNARHVSPCAGSILSNLYVAAVAHCFFDKITGKLNNREYLIGTSIENIWAQLPTTRFVHVKLVIIPNYYQPTQADGYNSRGDLAVVKMAEELGYISDHHPYLSLVGLPGHVFTHVGKNFTVAGFGWNRLVMPLTGALFPIGSTDGGLRFAKAHVLPDAECRDVIGDEIAEGNMCARVIQKVPPVPVKGICQYDSGAPLVYKSIIQGIAINGFLACDETQYPGIYINVTYYQDFIYDASNDRITSEMYAFELVRYPENNFAFVEYTDASA